MQTTQRGLSAKLRILHQEPDWVAIDKPPGFVAHPLEDSQHRVPRHQNCLQLLRDQLGQYVYPVHRLDRPTSGVLLYALNPSTCSQFQSRWHTDWVQKRYVALVRGWIEGEQILSRPLKAENGESLLESCTQIIPIAQGEFSVPYREFAGFRYTLLWALPETGRFHQIRRHLAGEGHPILGDTVHGDGASNRIAREAFGKRLFLQAQELSLGEQTLRARWDGNWRRAFDQVGCTPYWSEQNRVNAATLTQTLKNPPYSA